MKKRWTLAALVVVMVIAAAIYASIVIRLSREARRQPTPHYPRPAVVPLQAPAHADVVILPTVGDDPGDSIRTILARDLTYSDWIRVIPRDSATTAVAAVLRVRVTGTGILVRRFEPYHGTEIWSEEFPLSTVPRRRRWALHGVADAITEWITGHPGAAQSRVVYVAGHELRMVDADGADDRIVEGSGIPMSPSWRHDGAAIIYSELGDAGSQIIEFDVATRTRLVVPGTGGGLNITPVYSPDDRSVVYARYGDRGTELAIVPRTISRGTDSSRIATPNLAPSEGRTLSAPVPRALRPSQPGDESSPSFSPDGSRIAFAWSRARTPQIYSMHLDGTDLRLETPVPARGRSYRTSPDWSGDGRTIAYEQQNGDFQIWAVDVATSTMRRLTSTGENEDPSWAPDDRHLVFTSTRGGSKNLWILDIPTGHLRRLTTGGNTRLADWSPVFRFAW